MYAQMLVGMIALMGQWWLNSRKFKKHEVAAHVVNLAWNGLTGLEAKPTLTTDRAERQGQPRRRATAKTRRKGNSTPADVPG